MDLARGWVFQVEWCSRWSGVPGGEVFQVVWCYRRGRFDFPLSIFLLQTYLKNANKLSYFCEFSVQRYKKLQAREACLLFLDQETVVFLWFLAWIQKSLKMVQEILNPAIFWSFFTIFGYRNCSISTVSGSRNSKLILDNHLEDNYNCQQI